jgi:hypothetical protein
MRAPGPKRLGASVGLWLLPLLAAPAEAGFDPRTGRVSLDEAAVSLPFDQPDEAERLGPAAFLDGRFRPTTPGAGDFERDPEVVIEGDGALRLSETLSGLAVVLDGAAELLRGRRVEVRLWYRPQGSYPVAELVYLERGGVDALSDQSAFFAPLGNVRLLPTGRATDDGWVELSSGPVDWRLTGAIQARVLRILDARAWERALARRTSLEGAALVDGLEIVDVGEARHSGETVCTRGTEAATCGAGACHFGRCVDPKPILGNAPEDPALRRAYLERQIFRLQAFAGGRVPQSNLQRFAERLRSLNGETSLVRYWSVYRRAYDDVADGHLSEPTDRLAVPRGTGACIHLGELDVLRGAGQTGYLVYQVASDHPVGTLLRPGDALVEIDGLPVEDWVALSDRDLRYGGDPRGRAFIVAPRILDAALTAGSTLRFERCLRLEEGRCAPGAEETVTLDGAVLYAPLREGRRPAWWGTGLGCDYRFSTPPGISAIGRDRVGFTDADGVRTIVINGVAGFGQWRRDASAATTNLPGRVILDQRTGGGGTFQGVVALTAPFLSPNARPVAQILPWVPQFGPAERQQFARCLDSAGGGNTQCGNAFEEPLQGGRQPPSRVPEARVAILNGRDVSGNDYLAKALRDRATGATRIFGAVPTFGAFGPIFSLPRILDEQRGGSVQLQDTLFLASDMDDNTNFRTGIGVPPDEVILQRQSDALAGRDTLLRAAAAWVAGGQP